MLKEMVMKYEQSEHFKNKFSSLSIVVKLEGRWSIIVDGVEAQIENTMHEFFCFFTQKILHPAVKAIVRCPHQKIFQAMYMYTLCMLICQIKAGSKKLTPQVSLSSTRLPGLPLCYTILDYIFVFKQFHNGDYNFR